VAEGADAGGVKLLVFGGGAGDAEEEKEEREVQGGREGASLLPAPLLAPRGWLPLAPALPLCTCGRALTAPVPGFEAYPPGVPLPCLLHGGRL